MCVCVCVCVFVCVFVCVCVFADMEVVWNEVCVTCCQYHLHLYLGEMKVTEIPVGRDSKPGLQKRKVELGNENPRRNHNYLFIYLFSLTFLAVRYFTISLILIFSRSC